MMLCTYSPKKTFYIVRKYQYKIKAIRGSKIYKRKVLPHK